MLEQFQSVEELKAYADAKYKTILKLNKQIQDLKKQVTDVKENTAKVVEQQAPVMFDMSSKLASTDEETICVVQLRFIRDIAMIRELSKEEAQKVEIYAKTLNLIRNVPKKVEVNTKDLSNDQLLMLIDDTISKAN